MKRHLVQVLRNIAGLLLILFGVISGFLPILQGWMFIVIGLSLIKHPLKHRAHQWLGHRSTAYRTLATRYLRAKRTLRKKMRKKTTKGR